MFDGNPKYSVIIQAFNEEICLGRVIDNVVKVLDELGGSYEIICVDDCSSDQTWQIISQYHTQNPKVKGLKFLRNFGHQLAVYAGIRHCSGDYVAVMDADGQDPPDFLVHLFKKIEEGYDVVYAIRKNRKEFFLKRFAYKTFYKILRFILPFDVPLDSGDFAVFTKEVAQFIKGLKEHNPFIRGLRSWYGGKQVGLSYDRPKRMAGQSKYSFRKLLYLAINGAISFSKVPLRIVSVLGIVCSALSFLFGLYLLILKIFSGIELLGWTSTALLIIFFGGLNLFVFGIIGEYIGDIFEEVKMRPAFLVDHFLGIAAPKQLS